MAAPWVLGARPGTGARGNGVLSGPDAKQQGGAFSGQALSVRPMTSVAGAGYRDRAPPGTAGSRAGAPGSAGSRLPTIYPFKPEGDSGPQAQGAEMEMRVHALLESSASAAAKGDPLLALERAKEAVRRERALSKFREGNGQTANADLSFSVSFNLASMVRRVMGAQTHTRMHAHAHARTRTHTFTLPPPPSPHPTTPPLSFTATSSTRRP